MKKILFVSHTANFSKFNRMFMRWFRENGWQVDYASDGQEVVEDCDRSFVMQFERSPFNMKNIKAYKELRNRIEAEKYDIIHCHTPVGGVITRLAARKSRKLGTKVIYTGHGLHFYKGAPFINWLLYYPVEKVCAGLTDCLITINDEDYYNVKKHKFKAKSIEMVHGAGVDLSRFHLWSADEKQELRARFRIGEKTITLLCVAEINKNKNQEFLIEAVKKLVDQKHDVKLLIVGSGTEEEKLKYKVQESKLDKNVEFLGYRKDVEKLYGLSDMLVTASFREGLPVNIMEGMASGLPVLCTNTRGQRDLIKSGRNGYLYEVNDMEDFCKKVLRLYNDKKLLGRIAVYNLEDVKVYSSDVVMKEMIKIYQRYMEGKNAVEYNSSCL